MAVDAKDPSAPPRKRGRPKGSKNKSTAEKAGAAGSSAVTVPSSGGASGD